MKKALIITYYWPPSGGAGVQRWLKFVKYLRDFGWEPVVYCPENPEYPEQDLSLAADVPASLTVLKHPIWEPYRAYKRFIGRSREEKISAGFLAEKKRAGFLEKLSVWIRGNLFIPDARKFWIKPSARFLYRYLGRHPVDLVISTGPPHSCHLVALKLRRWSGLPWIADFRDPWTNIDFYKDLRLSRLADSRHRRLEQEVLSEADAVIAVSPSLAKEFNGIVPRDYHVVTNGYDEDDFKGAEGIEPDNSFSLAHIGSLTPSRNPYVLWKVLSDLIRSKEGFAADLEIRLTGAVDYTVSLELEKAGLLPYLKKEAYKPHDEAVRSLRRAAVLLLLINNTPNAGGILTGKFFEYLGSGRPILAIGPTDGDLAEILSTTGAGMISGFDDEDGLRHNILNLYRLYRGGMPRINPAGTGQYSRKSLTARLSEIMTAVAGRKP